MMEGSQPPPLQPGQVGPTLGTSLMPQAQQNGQAGFHEQTLLNQQTQPSHEEHLRKRRRVENGTGVDQSTTTGTVSSPQTGGFWFRSRLPDIQHHIQRAGGRAALSPEVEIPRFSLLEEACERNDAFFLALHQLYCAWSLDRRRIYAVFNNYGSTMIDSAFGVIELLLKRNTAVSHSNLVFFSQFPGLNQEAKPLIDTIGYFLARMAANWHGLQQQVQSRGYPFLVDELVLHLGCHSVTLQTIIFTASRRMLGIVDGVLGQSVELAFRNDQDSHRSGDSFVGTPFADQAQLEQNNKMIVQLYQSMVALARARGSGQPAVSSPSTLQDPTMPAQSSPPLPQPMQFAAPHHPAYPGQVPMRQMSDIANYPVFPSYAPAGLPGLHIAQPQLPAVPISQAAVRSPQIAQTGFTGVGDREIALMNQQRRISSLTASPGLVQGTQYSHLPPGAQFIQQQVAHPGMRPVPLASPTTTSAGIPPRQPTTTHQNPSYAAANIMINGALPARNPNGVLFSSRATHGTAAASRRPPGPLLPHKGYTMPRSEWPYDMADKKSIVVSLHQAHLRSPRRVVRETSAPSETNQPKERYYQSTKRLALGPVPIPSNRVGYRLHFEVSEEDLSMLSQTEVVGRELLPICEHFEGSLRYRLRSCRRPAASRAESMSETEWVTADTSWPANIFVQVNGEALTMRRHQHNGKDQAAELNHLVKEGTNTVEVSVIEGRADKNESGPLHFLSVEVIQTQSRGTIVTSVWDRFVAAEITLAEIQKRLTNSAGDDDDGVILQQEDLSIDLADPFSATLFTTPVRGRGCLHMECFDLENWLETRPAKAPPKCLHKMPCDCRNWKEPSNADRWRCPISACNGDARPGSLVVDGFLLSVREILGEKKLQGVKRVLVSAAGKWTPVIDEDDDGDGSDGEGPPRPALPRRKSSHATKHETSGAAGGIPRAVTNGMIGGVEIVDLVDD
jgi:zinc finger MIZ domain-containing protein